MNNLIKVSMMALAFASFSMAEGLFVSGHVSGAYSAFWGDSDMEDFGAPVSMPVPVFASHSVL